MLDNCQLHSGRLNNVLGYNLTVTGSDGKHDTVTSQVRIDFQKFSEAAVEQTVILRLDSAQPDQVAAVVTGLLAGDDSVQLLSLSLGQNTTDLFLAVQNSDMTYQACPLSVRETAAGSRKIVLSPGQSPDSFEGSEFQLQRQQH